MDVKPSPKKLARPSPGKKQLRMSDTKKTTPIRDTSIQSPMKEERESEKPMQPSSPDRRIGQKIGMRLRNLLKLPKAHKWVCYEWFYSNIDKYVTVMLFYLLLEKYFKASGSLIKQF